MKTYKTSACGEYVDNLLYEIGACYCFEAQDLENLADDPDCIRIITCDKLDILVIPYTVDPETFAPITDIIEYWGDI